MARNMWRLYENLQTMSDDNERLREALRKTYTPDTHRTPEMKVFYVNNQRGRTIACLAHSEAEAMDWANR